MCRMMLWVCFALVSSANLAAQISLPEVQPDWQLPYVVTEREIVYADTRGTWLRDSSGEDKLLLGGGRGFPPVVTEGRIYATNLKGDLLAWDRSTRQVLWSHNFEGWVFPPLLIHDSLFVSGQMHRLFQLNAATGKIEASVELNNEAIYQPVVWRDGQLAVGIYSRYWQVIKRDPLSLGERIEVPEPPKTATSDGLFLAQFGSVYQLQADGSFTRSIEGGSPVRWLKISEGQLYWSTGRRLWRKKGAGIDCLETEAGITHLGIQENGYRIQTTNFYGTSTVSSVSHTRGFSPLNKDKEYNDEKNSDRPDRDIGQQSYDVYPCRTLRDQ